MIMKNIIVPLACGLIFGAGLIIAGMTNPSKVMGFLNIFGNWDPSLMFVMGGAIIVSMPVFLLIGKKMKSPVFNQEEGFSQQLKSNIDRPLILGSAMFGVAIVFPSIPSDPRRIDSIIKSILCSSLLLIISNSSALKTELKHNNELSP